MIEEMVASDDVYLYKIEIRNKLKRRKKKRTVDAPTENATTSVNDVTVIDAPAC